MSALRYVVLRHEGAPGVEDHFDLMIERAPGSALATWRLPLWPPQSDTRATALGDHRADYLTYQGPLSDNRGSVRQIESGTYTPSTAKFNIQVYLLSPSNRKIMMRPTDQSTWAIWTAEQPPP